MRARSALLSLLWIAPLSAAELDLKPVKVADGVYAVVGDLGGQTYENDGLNSNLGFLVSPQGVLVVNTGPSVRVAKALHAAIRTITPRPVKWVVNVNSQNHYWHGNGYFKTLGAVIYAQRGADQVMRESAAQQFEANRTLLKDKTAGTAPVFADRLVNSREDIDLGGVKIELKHFGPAHTPGDLAVWLPKPGVMFSGDIVYTERLLAVIPIGNTGNWLKAFEALAAHKPGVIVPGHGHPTDLARAERETRDYLAYLRTEAKKAIDAAESPDEFAKRVDQSRFATLANFSELATRNANRIYLEIEKESF